ncbi:uncharacterized protein BDZ99DRAFT_462883 [Mytilinidion resinicola]|uniref:Uncharacterized protein n=1 Tax=Mytilinidion resinicola TaxID=574789 RepID=A0A6A6YN32_9PEZI|nr:uncharacterized protein BDZ99DRAFT_462883 [Mytilinidion resinicola]KAF2810296.1 hypothetical protein BDZ99DRAFT_462883 [Mytilinidion resinicola]
MSKSNRKISEFFGKSSVLPKSSLKDRDRTDSPATRAWPSSRTQSLHGDVEMREASDSPTPATTIKNATLTDEQLARKLQNDWNKETKAIVIEAPKGGEDCAMSGGSFSSINSSSSKRVFRRDQEVVANSDSDTDSSEGLEDMDYLLQQNTKKAPAPSPQKQLPSQITTFFNASTRPKKSILPPAKKYKFSIDSLVEETKKNKQQEQKFAAARAKLEETTVESAPSDTVEKTLASIVEDDEGGSKAERLLLAMRRTNALHRDPTWHFFRDDVEAQSRRMFPKSCLPHKGWASVFKEPNKRDQAFMAGYARHIFRYQNLPEELANWMIDELVFFPRDGVNTEYINTVECCPGVLSALLTPDKLSDIFRRLGAKDVGKDPSLTLTPSFDSPNRPKQILPTGLRWIVQLLQQVASDLTPESQVQALNILLRLSFDDSILFDVALHTIIQDTIKVFLESISEAELGQCLQQIINNLITAVEDPVLQDQLVTALPTSSPLTHRFQRRLALGFFLHPTPVTESLASAALPAIIHDHLSTSPDLQITRDFSYTSLGARMSLLDKAIGPGFSTLPFLAAPPTPASSSTEPSTSNTNANTPLPPSPEEKAFNESVDLLAARIKLLSNRITDASTSGMDRCEAKSVCQRLHYRLEGAVRTRGRRIKGVFGDGDEDEGKMIFKRFFQKDKAGVNGAV